MSAKSLLEPIKETFQEWQRDKAMRLSAALAFYTVFSLAPLLLIVVAIAGSVFGPQAIQGHLVDEFTTLVGKPAAEQIETMIQNAYDPSSGRIATVVGTVTLLLGAMGVFGQLKDALNTVWGAAPRHGSGLWGFIRGYVLSLAMVVGIAFLLLASLVVSAVLSAFGKWAADMLPASTGLLQVLNFVVSFAVIAVLFAMIFKVLPDVRIGWRDVWVGGGVTAFLFSIGKTFIGLYLGRSSVASVFGAAGSLAVLLVWVYYSAAVFLFGAEFTEVYSRRWGSRSRREDSLFAG
jgi:membrane protein